MKQFEYRIKDELGIHARPAGMLVRRAKDFESRITVEVGEKKADATKVFAIMGLGAKQGDTMKITVEGSDEEVAFEELEKFFSENF